MLRPHVSRTGRPEPGVDCRQPRGAGRHATPGTRLPNVGCRATPHCHAARRLHFPLCRHPPAFHAASGILPSFRPI
eukprot:366124-Chlamydomonas_euryale.AAC.16